MAPIAIGAATFGVAAWDSGDGDLPDDITEEKDDITEEKDDIQQDLPYKQKTASPKLVAADRIG